MEIVGRCGRPRWERDYYEAKKASKITSQAAWRIKNRRKLNTQFNPLEYKMSCILRELGVKFERNASFGKYFVDFWLPAYRIAIETDGKTHLGKEVYDAVRDKWLATQEVKVHRYLSTQVFQAPLAVKASLASLCGLSSEAAAR